MKQLHITFLITVLMSMVGAKAMAQTNINGIYYYFDYDKKTASVTSGYEFDEWYNYGRVYYTGYVYIPQSVTYNSETYTVTSISSSAFESCPDLEDVSIPNSVTSIGSYAFSGCSCLTSITIPNSVISIGSRAFDDCTNLTSIYIPNSIEEVGEDAFYGTAWYNNQPGGILYIGKCLYNYIGTMPANTSITVKEGTKSITGRAFIGCSGLASISIPNSVTSIGNSAFLNCSSLTNVNIPNSVTNIDDAFSGCTSLTNINIPNSVKSMNSAFSGCTSLTSVNIPNSVTSMSGAFSGCTSLTSVNIPNSVTNMSSAFRGCTSLTNIELPNSVKYMSGAFNNCTSLANVNIPTSVTSIDYETFKNCSSLTSIEIPSSIKSIGSYAFQGCSSLNNVVIPSSVTTIGEYAFQNCSSLANVIIPSTITSIGTAAFEGTAWYDNQPDGVLYSGNTVLGYKGTMAVNTYITIKDGADVIAASAFKNCSNMSGVFLPNTITNIGNNAFYGCSGLSSISIPSSVTSVGSSVFSGCSNLTRVSLYCQNVGSWFSSNTNINEVFIGEEVKSIDSNAFSGCTGLTKVEISDLAAWCNISFGYNGFNPLEYAHHLYLNGEEVKDLVIPGSVKNIGRAFTGCFGLTSVEIPTSVETIGRSAFSNCTGLTEIYIPNSVTHIYEGAFSGCTSLKNITIPNSIKYIGDDILSGCSGISITFHCNEVGAWFNNTGSIEKVILGDEVTSVAEKAFVNCSGLTTLIMGNTPVRFGANAFGGEIYEDGYYDEWYNWHEGQNVYYYCYNLKKVVTPNITAWCNSQFSGQNEVYANPLAFARHLYSNENTEINDLIIPDGVTDIHNIVFLGCASLTSVTIGNSVTTIGRSAFADCSGLTSITIPNSVTSFGWYAFEGCSGLTSITIPNSVTWIGSSAFYGTAWYNSQPDGLVYAGKVAYRYKGAMPANTNITLEEGTLGVAGSAFSGCSGLTSITIPNSVMSIGDYAFSSCSGLTSITIPNSVTSIGNDAFSSCSGLTSVTIPNSVTSIGSYAFYNCSGLTSVTVEWPEPISISSNVFIRTNATLYVPAGSKEAYQTANYWKEFKEIVELPDGKLFFEGTTVRCGSQSAIPVLFESEAAYGGLQCEVTLPAGITLNKVSKTARLSDAFTLTKSLTGDNTYQILLYNTERATFAGNDGALFTMTVDVADNMAVGNYDVTLSNIVVSDVDNNQTDLRDCTAVLRVENYLLGDANRDNRVNVTDIMAVANKILKYDVQNFNEHAADVNFDNKINVTDIMGIANIILKINTAAHAPAVQLPEPQ